MNIKHLLTNHFSDRGIQKLETIQILWSGYGEISRYFVPSIKKKIIVKHADFKHIKSHPKGWSTDISHNRKVRSYKNEVSFYQDFSGKLNEMCKAPELLFSYIDQDNTVMIMEDLVESGFAEITQHPNINQVKQALIWLARFHSTFIGSSGNALWEQGSYWHLDTRQDEWRAMPNCELKQYARQISDTLHKSQYSTLIHGDAKVANFCFDPTSERCAAVDYQYAGLGIGVIDLTYFIGSCFFDSDLQHWAPKLTTFYFENLAICLNQIQPNVDAKKLIEEWKQLLPFAWADFERFLLGWSPEHKKLSAFSAKQTESAIKALSDV